ncbi:MEDS domain-containing protein [Streptomyces sp. NPDC091272]|uniref:MEDS domain-containing protein n=1 Tax=Streptomyces sp. NPDC091272 TaxID=3365981 RepID=UPI0037F757FD
MADTPRVTVSPGQERVGRHAAVVYSDDRQWAAHLCAFVRDGLDRDEQIRYFADATEPARVLHTLTEAGIDAAGAVRRGQLAVSTAAQTYLAGGGFDPDQVIALWYEAVAEASAQGFRALRAIGEMSWGARDVAGADRLLEYELRMHHEVFERLPLTAWCFYDRRPMPKEGVDVLAGAHLTHRGTCREDVAPRLALRVAPLAGSSGFLLSGSAGHESRHVVAAAAAAVTNAPDARVELDLSALRHLDAASLLTLAEASDRRPGNVPLRIREAPATVRRLLDLFPELSSSVEVVGR